MVHTAIRFVFIVWLSFFCHVVNAYTVTLSQTENPLNLAIDMDLPTIKEIDGIDDPVYWLNNPLLSEIHYSEASSPSPYVFWHRLVLKGDFTDDSTHRFYLDFYNQALQYLDIYIFSGKQLLEHHALGRNQNMMNKSLDYQGFVLPIAIKNQQELTLMIRKSSNTSMIMPIKVYDERGFQQHLVWQYLFWGGIIALVIGIGLYNIATYVLIRRPAYLWYLAFYGISFLYFGGLHGFGYLLWGGEIQYLLVRYESFIHLILIWMFLHFSNLFLCSKEYAPKEHKWLLIFDIIVPLAAVAALFLTYSQHIFMLTVFQALAAAYCLLMCVISYRNGFAPARLFGLSWIVFFILIGICLLAYINLLPANFFTLHAFILGSLIEMLFLSVALTDRFNFSEKQALLKAYTDPKTQLPNYSFFKNELSHSIENAHFGDKAVGLVIAKANGIRSLVGLLGSDAVEKAFKAYLGRANNILSAKPWALEIPVENGSNSYFLSVADGQILFLFDASYNWDDVMQEFLAFVEKPLHVGDVYEYLRLNIGASVYKPGQSSMQECYRQVQLALLESMHSKKRWCFYRTTQDVYIREQVKLLSELRGAITNGYMTVFIQPQYSLSNHTLVGGEVLARWVEQGTMTSPGLFIPLAEKSNLIFDITKTVIEQSFNWLNVSAKQLPANFNISINLSAKDIHHPEMIGFITQMVKKYQIRPEQVMFEVTESAIAENPHKFTSVTSTLQSMGFLIALDDFGTGYSSMSYLQRIKANVIKIDISFIRDIDKSDINYNIVQAIIQLAKASQAKTVAEGIETQEELSCLKQLGADYMQGFLLNKPLPVSEFDSQVLSRESGIKSS